MKLKTNESGIILIIVIWVMIILSMLALSLGRGSHIDLSLTKHGISKAKTKYYAWAGLIYAIDLIRQDTEDDEASKLDTLFMCGIPEQEGRSLSPLFEDKPIGDGKFSIQYAFKTNEILKVEATMVEDGSLAAQQAAVANTESTKPVFEYDMRFGFMDEERKINLNAITKKNRGILSSLVEILGGSAQQGKEIAAAVVDWRDEDEEPVDDVLGAESDYYQSAKSYAAKNLPFESVEELMMLRGMTEDVYERLKDYVTVYGQKDKLLINFDTATEPVLKALGRHASGLSPSVEYSDVDSFVNKLMDFRNGPDGKPATRDDKQIDQDVIGLLLAPEKILYLVTNQFRTKKSDYLRVFVKAKDARDTKSSLEAVISRQDLSVVYWKRQ